MILLHLLPMATQHNGDKPVKTYPVWNSTLKRKAPLPKNSKPIQKSSKPIARNVRPNKESARRKKERPIYQQLCKENLEQNPFCRANISEGCTKENPRPSTQNHHMLGRGKNYIVKETLLAICDGCHEVCHDNTELAKQLGASKYRNRPS